REDEIERRGVVRQLVDAAAHEARVMAAQREQLLGLLRIGVEIDAVKLVDDRRNRNLQGARAITDLERRSEATRRQHSKPEVDALAKEDSDVRAAVILDRIGRSVLRDAFEEIGMKLDHRAVIAPIEAS